MSTQVTFETDHIFLQHDLTMSSALNSGMYFFVILKKKILKKSINSITLICQKSGSVGPVQQNVTLPLSYMGN